MKALRLLAAALLIMVSACSGGEVKPNAAAGPPADAKQVDPAVAGSVSGRVRFEGPAPENPLVKLTGDPMCARAHAGGMAFENYVVTDGGLDNVFVHVKDGSATTASTSRASL